MRYTVLTYKIKRMEVTVGVSKKRIKQHHSNNTAAKRVMKSQEGDSES